MKSKQLFVIILSIALMLTALSACKNNDAKEDADKTAVPTVQTTVEPSEKPTEAPTEAPTKEPTSAPTSEPTSEPTQKPLDGAVDLNELIENAFGGASVDDSSTITVDVMSSYGDIAYFSLENSENFTLSFRVRDYLPTENHQQVGIIIAPDVRNLAVYGKFMRTFSNSNVIESYGTDGSWYAPEGTGSIPDAYTSSDSLFMKVVRNGATIGFYVSADGSEWSEINQFDCQFTSDLQIGFTGATFTTADAHAVIDNVKIIYG